MNRLTATLITLNEEENLPRALDSLHGLADEIVVVDSGSTDRTAEVARQRGARILVRSFTDYGDQKNFAAAQASNDWILSLDADEELSPELRESLRVWKQQSPAAPAYAFARRANFLGRWIRHSGWYPDWKTRLYDRRRARFIGRVHESVEAEGKVERLAGDLLHYAYRSVADQTFKLERYTTLAAEQLFASGRRGWRGAMLISPPWTFFQKLILQLGFLDGPSGWQIARLAARYVYLKYHKLGVLARGGRLESPRARRTDETH